MKSVLLAFLTIIAAGTGESRAVGDNSLALTKSIVLKGVSGRIDHMAIDVEGRQLFVAALGNNTIEVIDLAAGSRIGTIPRLKEPQGVVYLPEFNRIAVANGGDGSVRYYDGKSLQPAGSIDLKDDADNRRIYLSGGIGRVEVFEALDADHYKLVSQIQTALGARTSFFSRDMMTLFVAIPGLLLRQAQISAYSIP
jgi:YVTN family beta-propeller protein